VYQGDKKGLSGITPFTGFSNSFKVVARAELEEAVAGPTIPLGLTARLSNAIKHIFHP
jgi:hypothetical protein